MASTLRSSLGSVSVDVKGIRKSISQGLKEGAQHITGKTSKRQGLYKKHLLDGAELKRLSHACEAARLTDATMALCCPALQGHGGGEGRSSKTCG